MKIYTMNVKNISNDCKAAITILTITGDVIFESIDAENIVIMDYNDVVAVDTISDYTNNEITEIDVNDYMALNTTFFPGFPEIRITDFYGCKYAAAGVEYSLL